MIFIFLCAGIFLRLIKYKDAISNREQVPLIHALRRGKCLTNEGTKSGFGIIFRITTTVKTITETTMLSVKNFLSVTLVYGLYYV